MSKIILAVNFAQMIKHENVRFSVAQAHSRNVLNNIKEKKFEWTEKLEHLRPSLICLSLERQIITIILIN